MKKILLVIFVECSNTNTLISKLNLMKLDYDILKDNKSVVILSEEDAMVPSLTIFKKLTQNMVPCLLVEGAIHSDIFTNKEFQCVRDYIIDFVAFC